MLDKLDRVERPLFCLDLQDCPAGKAFDLTLIVGVRSFVQIHIVSTAKAVNFYHVWFPCVTGPGSDDSLPFAHGAVEDPVFARTVASGARSRIFPQGYNPGTSACQTSQVASFAP